MLLWGSESLAAQVELPIDIGLGPASLHFNGPLAAEVHTGLALSVRAIVDRQTVRRFRRRIPREYRKAALSMDEIRISPSIFIPEVILLSPWGPTKIYGVGWRPVSLGSTLMKEPVRVAANMGAVLTYAWIGSPTLGTTHFLRPGIDLRLDLERALGERFLISASWTSRFYPPQQIGADPTVLGELGDSLWHLGQAAVLLHLRFPYTIRL